MRKHVHVIYVNIGWGDFGQFYGGKNYIIWVYVPQLVVDTRLVVTNRKIRI